MKGGEKELIHAISRNMAWPFLSLGNILLLVVILVSTAIEASVILFFYDLGVGREALPFVVILANAITAMLGYVVKKIVE